MGGPPPGWADAQPIAIRQSRRKAARLLLLSVVFVAAGAWMAASETGLNQAAGVLSVVFFGLGVLLFGWQLVRPGCLLIGPDGITERTMGRTRRFAWHEAAGFRVWEMHGTALVAFDDLRSPGVNPRLRAVNRALGAEGALRAGWTVPPQKLADLLNAEQARWLQQGSGQDGRD